MSLLSLSVITAYQLQSMWPHFGGLFNNNTRLSPFIGSQVNRTKWMFSTQSAVSSSPAISSDGNVYVGSYDNNFYAISSSGSLIWKFATGGGILSSPAIGSDGTLYVGSAMLYALYYWGSLKWSCAIGSTQSSPTIGSDGTVYIGSNSYSCVYAISSLGTVLWTYPGTGGWVQGSAAIGSDGTIYIGSNSMYALSPSGTAKWVFGTSGAIGLMTPAIGLDGTIYVSANSGTLYALTSFGSMKWKFSFASSYEGSAAIGSDVQCMLALTIHTFMQ